MSEIKPNDNAYYIPEKPVYDPVIRALKTSDPANADTVFNPLFSQIIENVHAVNLHANNTDNEFKEHSNNKNNPHNVTAAQAGASNPNMLINGDFQVWQRGLSFSGGGYTADRWNVVDHNQSQTANNIVYSNDIPSGTNGASAEIDIKNLEDEFIFSQVLENELVAGNTYTLSSWVKGPVGATIQMAFMDTSDTYTMTGNWQYITLTRKLAEGQTNRIAPFRRPSRIGKYYIKNVKLEYGETATLFVPRSYGEELALCKRYYRLLEGVYFLAFAVGLGESGEGAFQLNIEGMRVTPSVVFKMPSDSGDLCNVYSVSSASNYPASKFTFGEVSADGLYNFTTTVNENERNLAIRGGNGSYADAEIHY